jgi:hypothetical protein
MAFSFADLGFWRLAVVALAFELLHALLEIHWPAIRGSGLGPGPRPPAARFFMLAESVVLIVALSAAIGTVARMLNLEVRPTRQISAVVLAALGLLVIFSIVWQS